MSSVKVTIIGAGSAVFSRIGQGSLPDPGLAGSEVLFMDINDDRLDIVYRLGLRYAEDLGSRPAVQARRPIARRRCRTPTS